MKTSEILCFNSYANICSYDSEVWVEKKGHFHSSKICRSNGGGSYWQYNRNTMIIYFHIFFPKKWKRNKCFLKVYTSLSWYINLRADIARDKSLVSNKCRTKTLLHPFCIGKSWWFENRRLQKKSVCNTWTHLLECQDGPTSTITSTWLQEELRYELSYLKICFYCLTTHSSIVPFFVFSNFLLYFRLRYT